MRPVLLAQNPVSQDQIRDEAAEWLVAVTAHPALEQDRVFRAWLAADSRHAAAFAKAQQAWQIAGLVGADLAAEAPVAVVPLRPAGRRLWRAGAGLALAASLAGAFWLNQVRPDLRLRLLADHASVAGEIRDFALQDGSRTLLDGGSALDFTADSDSRRVTLLTGAAWFDVEKDGRPFTVQLGETEIRALGTQFGVRDCGNCVEISLEEGSIAVTAPGLAEMYMTPGQQMRLRPGSPPQLAGTDAPEALAWRDGRYIFYDVTLREVAGVLARHGAGAILFGDAALADRKISGSISLIDTGAELQALSEAMGFRILALPGGNLLM